jgi:Mg-chelatase subunit ChlD
LTDEEYFGSSKFNAYLSKLTFGIFKKWRLRQPAVNVIADPNDADLALTNGCIIKINACSKFLDGVKRKDKIFLLLGLLFHEIGHILFTPFNLTFLMRNAHSVCSMFPGPPDISEGDELTALAEMMKMLEDERKRKKYNHLIEMLCNVCEDARIEYLLLAVEKDRIGFCEGLTQFREFQKFHFEQDIDPESEKIPLGMAINRILYRVLYGKRLAIPETTNDDLAQTIRTAEEQASMSLHAVNAAEFADVINRTAVILWPLIKPLLEPPPKGDNKQGKSDGGSGGSTGDDELEQLLSKIPSPGAGSAPKLEENAGASEQQIKHAIKKAGLDPKEPGGKSTGTNASEQKNEEDEASAASGGENMSGDNDSSISNPERLLYEDTDEILEGEGACIEREQREIADIEYDSAAIATALAEQKISRKEEDAMLSILNAASGRLKIAFAATNVHKNCTMKIVTVRNAYERKGDYEVLALPLRKIAVRLAKRLRRKFESEPARFVKRKYYGTRFDAGQLAKADLRYFSQRKIKGIWPSLALVLLVDMSGSMMGERARMARNAAILLHIFAKELGIACGVYGHRNHGTTGVEITSYADIAHPTKDDAYRLMDIHGAGCNRDGAALIFAAEQLVPRPELNKLAVVISDGQPSAPGYEGTAAEVDMQSIIERYGKKGIKFIAAAIGEDRPSIKRIYGKDSFLDITDLEKLPDAMIRLVKHRL